MAIAPKKPKDPNNNIIEQTPITTRRSTRISSDMTCGSYQAQSDSESDQVTNKVDKRKIDFTNEDDNNNTITKKARKALTDNQNSLNSKLINHFYN